MSKHKDKQHPHKAAAPTNGSPSTEGNAANQNKPKKRFWRDYDPIEKFNLMLVVCTGIYSAISIGLFCVARGDLKVATQSLQDSQRSSIVVGNKEGIGVELLDIGDKGFFGVYLTNSGRSTAHDVLVKVSAMIAPPSIRYDYTKLIPAKGFYELGPNVGQGQPHAEYFEYSPKSDIDAVIRGEKIMRVVGRVTYWDDFGDYCVPIGFVSVKSPSKFESMFIPPRESVCEPQAGEGEVFSINAQGAAAVQFDLRHGLAFHNERNGNP